MSVFQWLQGGSKQLKETAALWAAELEEACFEVVLIPAYPQKHALHSIRALQSGNPGWYQRFCAQYVSTTGRGRRQRKRPRTFIKKRETIKHLLKISKGEIKGIQGERLVRHIREEMKRTQPPPPGQYELLRVRNKILRRF